MSRGFGRWQRAILAQLAESSRCVILTHPDDSVARQVAVRRAARSLEAAGLVVLVRERAGRRKRLVAYPSESAYIGYSSGFPFSSHRVTLPES